MIVFSSILFTCSSHERLQRVPMGDCSIGVCRYKHTEPSLNLAVNVKYLSISKLLSVRSNCNLFKPSWLFRKGNNLYKAEENLISPSLSGNTLQGEQLKIHNYRAVCLIKSLFCFAIMHLIHRLFDLDF